MAKPTVSILIASYNSAAYLPPLCDSIQKQTFRDFEAIVWDDGSTDNSQEVLQRYRDDDRFVLLQASKNQGVGKTWAELLRRMRGEFWCAPGSDDVLHPDFLDRRVAAFLSRPNAVLVHGPPVHINAAGEIRTDIRLIAEPPPVQGNQEPLRSLLQHNFINQPSTLIRSSSTIRVLPYWRDDWRYAQEWHLWLLLAALDHEFVYDPIPAHRYRVHDRSLSNLAGHDAVRRTEVRLVPLVGLSGAAQLTPLGQQMWKRWRRAMYALWLRRAFVLRNAPDTPRCVQIGADAFAAPEPAGRVTLLGECTRHALSILHYSLREAAARRSQTVLVSGLAQVNHELFMSPARGKNL